MNKCNLHFCKPNEIKHQSKVRSNINIKHLLFIIKRRTLQVNCLKSFYLGLLGTCWFRFILEQSCFLHQRYRIINLLACLPRQRFFFWAFGRETHKKHPSRHVCLFGSEPSILPLHPGVIFHHPSVAYFFPTRPRVLKSNC